MSANALLHEDPPERPIPDAFFDRRVRNGIGLAQLTRGGRVDHAREVHDEPGRTWIVSCGDCATCGWGDAGGELDSDDAQDHCGPTGNELSG